MTIVRKALRAALIMMLCAATICGSALADTADYTGVFPDVPVNADYAEAVETLYEMGVFSGDNNGNFNPDSTITRAEAAAVICRLMGVEDEAKAMTNQVFTDVPTSYWAVGYIAKVAEMGIVSGYGNGKFGPGNPVTYEQMVKMLLCAWGYKEIAENAGGWPQGYLDVANDLGVGTYYDVNTSQYAARKTVALLCCDMLLVYENFE